MVQLPYASLLGSAVGYLISDTAASRTIGGIQADVTVEELHDDELTITDHPVEQGASITDHAFKRPARLTVRAGFSNSASGSSSLSQIINGVTSILNSLSGDNHVNNVYSQLLTLQSSLTPISVVTGKRNYNNMLITRLSTETDARSENSMVINIHLQEIIVVSTQTVSTGDPSNMANPSANGGIQNMGTQQLSAAPNFNTSAASSLV